MDDKQHEFTIHEFDALREEINGYFQEMRKLEVYAVVATAIMYSFLISLERGGNDVLPFHAPILVWGLPILFPILIFIRARAFHNQVVMIGSYIKKVEEQYGRNPLGWENREKNKSTESRLARSNYVFIVFLAIFSTGLFLWRLCARSARMNRLAPITATTRLPALIAVAGERASLRFLEFFAANIRNPHTRRACSRAVAEFLAWRDQQKVPSVAAVQPLHVAAWIEQQTREHAAPTAKLRLAALTEARENGLAADEGEIEPASQAEAAKRAAMMFGFSRQPVTANARRLAALSNKVRALMVQTDPDALRAALAGLATALDALCVG